MKKYLLFFALASISPAFLLMVGCSSANVGAVQAWGRNHIVKQYSGGQLIGQWTATGKVENEGQSDGYYFTDAATGKLVVISGDVQITVK